MEPKERASEHTEAKRLSSVEWYILWTFCFTHSLLTLNTLHELVDRRTSALCSCSRVFFSFFSFFRSFKSLEEILLLSFRSFTHYNCTLGDYHVVLWSNYESRTAICHIIANKASKHSSSLLAVSLVCGDGVFFFRSPHNSRTVNNWVNSCYILFWIHTAHLQLWSGRELFQLQLRYCLACALSVSLSCFFFSS